MVWCHLGSLRFTDPFFDQTVNQCFRHPANVLFQHETPMSALGELHGRRAGLVPSGFIFHASRCGSTLLSQMLAALPENVVISEAGPVGAILRSHQRDPGITEEERVLWLRWLLNAFGQRRFPGEKHLFVKFECWQVLLLPLIRRAFPDVPWIFLYRDPVEVVVSHKNRMGRQLVPGALEPALFGWEEEEVRRMGWAEYGGRVLGKILEAAWEHAQTGTGKLVHYRQLPHVVWSELVPFWKADFAPGAVEKMAGVVQFDAKNPLLPYADDTSAKARGVTDEIRGITRQWLDEPYQRLEARRLEQLG
jgi:hypothetical protein